MGWVTEEGLVWIWWREGSWIFMLGGFLVRCFRFCSWSEGLRCCCCCCCCCEQRWCVLFRWMGEGGNQTESVWVSSLVVDEPIGTCLSTLSRPRLAVIEGMFILNASACAQMEIFFSCLRWIPDHFGRETAPDCVLALALTFLPASNAHPGKLYHDKSPNT